MCRLAAYLGRPRPLASLIYDAPHGLERQAYAPEMMVNGHVNSDGTAVVWWHQGRPVRYVTESPPWSDGELRRIASTHQAGVMVAAVRTATPGVGYGVGHVQPWMVGGYGGVHNGWIEGFTGAAGDELIAAVGSPELLTVHNDSLATVLLAAQLAGGDPSRGVEMAVGYVDALVRRHGGMAALNVGLVAGGSLAVARHAIGQPHNSLFVLQDGNGIWVASEPLDGALWREVPESHLVTADGENLEVRPLELRP